MRAMGLATHAKVCAAAAVAMAAILGGCAQSTSTTTLPPERPPAVTPAPAPATAPAPAPSTEPAQPEPTVRAGNDPAEVERRAREQAKAIEALLAGNNPPPATEPEVPPPPMPVERPKNTQSPAQPADNSAPSPTPAPVPVVPPPVTMTDVPPPPPTPPPANAEGPVANTGVTPPPPEQVNRAQPPVPPRQQSRATPQDDSLSNRIESSAKNGPRDVAAQFDQQMLEMIRGHSVPTPESYSSLPPDDREMLSTLVDGLQMFRAGVAADPNMLMTKKIRPLLDMTDRMRAESDLSLSRAAICSDVKAFGIFTPMDPARFVAGTPARFHVYVEIANFMSKLDSANQYVTNLHQDLVLYTETGVAVATLSSSNVSDVSRSRRHDFFLRTPISLPLTLNTGRHVIKVTVVDQNAAHVAETTIPLTIVAR